MSMILVVHPESSVRALVSSMLEKAGHRAEAVHDGPAALGAFKRLKPEIVVLNQELHGLPSFQVFAEIKRIDPKAKVLVFALQADSPQGKDRPKFGIRAFQPSEVLQIIAQLQGLEGQEASRAGEYAPRVLVVDDEKMILDTMRRFLTKKGYEVAVASNGMDALPLLKRLRPHLVLLDIDMPKMNGIETLKRIRELDGEAGVMMITGNTTIEMMEQCGNYGAYDYLLKPFDFEYLEFSVYSKILLMTL